VRLLMVDDQIQILNGLISGVDWIHLGVDEIRTAQGAGEAREILCRERIDILLCDIEMPGENGLSLLRWVRRQKMDVVCVFLTAHADFLYAREAMQLGCMDYILQPARYEDIEYVIGRAMKQVEKKQKEKKAHRLQKIVRSNPAGVFQNFFTDWASGRPLTWDVLQPVLSFMNPEIQGQNRCCMVLAHLLSWSAEPWQTREWEFALQNILAELMGENGSLIPFSVDAETMGWLLTGKPGSELEEASVKNITEKMQSFVARHLPCTFVFYRTRVTAASELPGEAEQLRLLWKSGRQGKNGIYLTEVLQTGGGKQVDLEELVSRAEAEIEESMAEPLTVSDLAGRLYVSPDYLTRVFRQRRGVAMKEYILKRKMETADILLRTTSLPVSVIAGRCGYDNFSHFSQIYRKYTGMSPTEVRNNHGSDRREDEG
jgi:two-component system response regulator YesN